MFINFVFSARLYFASATINVSSYNSSLIGPHICPDSHGRQIFVYIGSVNFSVGDVAPVIKIIYIDFFF